MTERMAQYKPDARPGRLNKANEEEARKQLQLPRFEEVEVEVEVDGGKETRIESRPRELPESFQVIANRAEFLQRRRSANIELSTAQVAGLIAVGEQFDAIKAVVAELSDAVSEVKRIEGVAALEQRVAELEERLLEVTERLDHHTKKRKDDPEAQGQG